MKIQLKILAAIIFFCFSHIACGRVYESDEAVDDKQLTEHLASSTTVYGYIRCRNKGLSNVIVSDGYQVAKTNAEGMYQLPSAKKLGYVFVSIPSGYTAPSIGVLPQIHKAVDKQQKLQKIDFELIDDGDQSEYELIAIGDIQLARRSDDISQFHHFTSEINRYLDANKGKKVFGITLGDATWDSHWLSGPYGFKDYLGDINEIHGLQVFHTMGNHDHELEAEGDFYSSAKYRSMIGPTYYSFNIGKFHYVVLDDIECTNDGTGTKATYNTYLVKEQINWLKRDLAAVPKNTPLIITMHAPLYRANGDTYLKNADDMLKCIQKFSKVYILSGHTHIIYNVDKLDQEPHVMELNSGSICGTWWYTGYDHPWLHIGKDGSPGGYRILNISGENLTWYFKGIERPADYQFRSYDRNEIHIDIDKVAPSAKEKYREQLAENLGEYGELNKENYIYVNVWDWDPSWKVEISENGKPLKVTRFKGTDPLHVMAYSVTRANMNKSLSFPSVNTRHLFKTKASAPDTTIEIKVTDRFGRIYKETMTRPKAFSIEACMK